MRTRNSSSRIQAILFTVTGIAVILSFAGCGSYRKVPATYRQSPLIEDLDSKNLLIGTFYQRCSGFQAVTDMVRILQRKLEKEKVFRQIQFTLDVKAIGEEQDGIKESMDLLTSMERHDMKDFQADLLLIGAIMYNARDRSGYDSEWQLNQYGYRVPKKVYRDRLSFDLELGLVLIDLKTGAIILQKTYEDRGLAEGAADEIAVYYDLIEKQLVTFLDQLQGKEMKTKRYLLYR